MDEFGVLVESIGFKAQGRSAPMSKLKQQPKPNSPFTPSNSVDGIFRSNSNNNFNSYNNNDDIFGSSNNNNDNQFGGVDFESVFVSSSSKSYNGNSNYNSYDDLFGLNEDKTGGNFVHDHDDVFGFLGVDSNSGATEKKANGFDDLLPGFGGGVSASNQGTHTKVRLSPPKPNHHSPHPSSEINDDPFLVFEKDAKKSSVHTKARLSPPEPNHHSPHPSSKISDDPFLVFEKDAKKSSVHTKARLSPPEPNHHSPHPSSEINDDPFLVFEKDAKKSSIQVSLDDLDDFVTGRGHKEPIITGQTRNNTDVSSGFSNVDDLLFGGSVRPKHDSKPSSNAQDSQFDFLFNNVKPKVQPPPNTRKYSPTTGGDDITALFGDVSVSTVEFQEIDGEPADRRDARFKRYTRMKKRMDIALEEKNQRDLRSQYEQEEKHRLAESLDYDIKRWAAGKEGNLRALLSSLQQVLWPECGWRAVSLTDMITSGSVKKVYMKATLCVHPDKVQQKGASIQQKYIAEKVFDILKEAWNKFSAEELR